MIWEKAGLVAQLDRAPRYGRGGLGFDSLQGHSEKKGFQVKAWDPFLFTHYFLIFSVKGE